MSNERGERLPESIELLKNGLEVSVNTQGAWVDSLKYQGEDILYPKFQPDPDVDKFKGGMHVCLPQFGPDSEFGLPQHGFGRDLNWEMTERGTNSVILHLSKQPSVVNYPEGLEAWLRYSIEEAAEEIGLHSELYIMNSGEKSLPVAPAFHPYFKVQGKPYVEEFDEPEMLADLESFHEAHIVDMPESFVVSLYGSNRLELSSDKLNRYAFWTNKAEDYLCIEPTEHGANFSREDRRSYVHPAQSVNYRFAIDVLKENYESQVPTPEEFLEAAYDLLEADDRQVLIEEMNDQDSKMDIEDLEGYLYGRLFELGYDPDDVFDQAKLMWPSTKNRQN